jgi:alginate O-acetyltransferase complex protein AlgI
MFIAAWIVGILAVITLIILSWRHKHYPITYAVLVIIASTSLSLLLTSHFSTVLLMAINVLLVAITWYLCRTSWIKGMAAAIWISLLVLILIAVKGMYRQPLLMADTQIAWVGLSYFIFRLIHITIDGHNNKLGQVSLPEMITYTLHPATLISGPIDRIKHSIEEQHHDPLQRPRYVQDGLWRLFIGAFKKVVLVNIVYVFLSAYNVPQNPYTYPRAIVFLWIASYSFYLYFDFAAYSDLAVGVGLLMGIKLPDNFANPYAQPDLARFWQAWHITLSTWLRDYIFFPISRRLLRRLGQRFSTIITFFSHILTMTICGLWHGISSGFVAWGIWHGLGLFAHSQVPQLRQRFGIPRIPNVLGTLFTFCFVALGWVFFGTDLHTALHIFARLVGLR